MRLNIVRSKNAASFYVIKSVRENGKSTTKIVEKLGTESDLREKYPDKDPYQWAKEYVDELNQLEREGQEPDIITKYSPSKIIPKDIQNAFNGGYLFLQDIFYSLGLDKMCKNISKNYKFAYDLSSVLSRLIYTRILFPGSKLSCMELSHRFIEQPKFNLQHIYRALDVLHKESDLIQSTLYKNSTKIIKRGCNVLFYDCTNFFFEIETEDDFRKYGVSKEHRPNPLVQMGLFMDSSGIPLAFSINPGNTNEQLTMKPLEKQILSDFELSKFIVCTDAGLSSTANRKFNNIGGRGFITTQSIKKLKGFIKEWALSPDGWSLEGSKKKFNIQEIDEEKDFDKIYYKERWIKENELEQRIIVTYSLKYKNYQRTIRLNQIERALKIIEENPRKLTTSNQNDCKRFIERTDCTKDGEIAEKTLLSLKQEQIDKEKEYDGFYGVCTNLEDEASKIININRKRWEIEECFRIMKNEFLARPLYLSLEERIEAHFTTCFMALVIYRILEKKLEEKYTCSEIISNLKNMNFCKSGEDGYIPAYIRNDFTDDLHEVFGFRTDMEILTKKNMKKILKTTKS